MNDFDPLTVYGSGGKAWCDLPAPERVAFSRELLAAGSPFIAREGEDVVLNLSNVTLRYRPVRSERWHVVCEKVTDDAA